MILELFGKFDIGQYLESGIEVKVFREMELIWVVFYM